MKTRKAEALELLAILESGGELTRKQSYRLTFITIEQAFPIIRQHPEELEKFREHEKWYHISVDECLSLEIPGKEWVLYPSWGVGIYEVEGYHELVVKVENKSLPFAMLKAYWLIQPD